MNKRFMGLALALTISICGVGARAGSGDSDPIAAAKAEIHAGESAAATGDWSLAKKHFVHANELDPKNVIGFYDLGVTLVRQGWPYEALQAERQALAIDPNFAPAYVELSSILYHMRKYDLAADACHAALRLDPSNVTATQNLAAINSARPASGDHPAPQKHKAPNAVLKPAIANSKRSEDPIFAEPAAPAITAATPATTVIASSQPSQSSSASVVASETASKSQESAAEKSIPQVQSSVQERAAEEPAAQAPAAEEPAAQAPIVPAATGQTKDSTVQGDSAKSASAASHPEKPDPKATVNTRKAQALIASGQAAYRKGQIDIALKKFDDAIALDGGISIAYADRGVVLGGKGDYEGEIANEKKAVELDSKNAFAYSSLGWAEAKMQHWDQALESYQQALALKPDLQEAELGQALALFHSGQRDAGVAAMRVLKNKAAGEAGPLVALGTMLEEEGRMSEAEVELRAAVQLAPRDLDARQQLGNLLLAKGAADDSAIIFKDIVSDFPSNAAAHAGLSMALELSGDNSAAESEARKALALNPKLQIAQASLDRLEQKKTEKPQ